MHSRSSGFSLIEVSFALAIIALIVGAISAGVSLLEATKLRSITSEVEEFKRQTNLFQSKFRALPGDFRDAGALWGNNCANSTSGSDTCSGNGNGLTLENDIASTTSESFRAWQHLDRANLGRYELSGMPGSGCSGDDCAVIGENIPESSWSSSGYSFYSGNDDHVRLAVFLGGEASGGWNSVSVLDPAQIANIDNKTDDQNPVTGTVRGSSIPGRAGDDESSCVNDDVAGSEVYIVANEGTAYCTPAFILVMR